MRISRMVCASVVAGLGLVPGAAAQSGPSEIVVDGVPIYHELALTQPTRALSTFKAAKTHSAAFDAHVTTSDDAVELSAIDGGTGRGRTVGRFTRGSESLPLPLDLRVRGSAFGPLDADGVPLARLTGPVSRRSLKLDVRQRVERRTTGTYRKLVLVTLSGPTP